MSHVGSIILYIISKFYTKLSTNCKNLTWNTNGKLTLLRKMAIMFLPKDSIGSIPNVIF